MKNRREPQLANQWSKGTIERNYNNILPKLLT